MAGRKKDTPTPAVKSATRNTTATVVVVTVHYAYGLNVRENPDTGARVLRVLKNGEQIEVDNNVTAPKGWVAVAGSGFVMKRYLK